MQTETFDPSDNAPSQAQVEAEAAALAQGEKLAQIQQEDREAQFQQLQNENEDVGLLAGKFRNQEELIKAYEELQKKLGRGETEDGDGEEEEADVPEGEVEEVVPEQEQVLSRAADEYTKGGELSEESIEALSQMDSKDLIKAYVDFYSKNAQNYQQQVELQQAETQQIFDLAGGPDKYQEMVQWASSNLDPQEVDSYNAVTNSGSLPAIKFAVEALANRYKAAEGSEGKLISGKKPRGKASNVYRSNAELARDIADPRYASDPAFRADVEEKLSRSENLL